MRFTELHALTVKHRWEGTKDKVRSSGRAWAVIEELGLQDQEVHQGRPWMSYRLAVGEKFGTNGTGNRYLSAFSALLRTAEEGGVLQHAPRFRRWKESEPKSRVMSLEEERAVVPYLSPQAACCLYVLLDTGVRLGELLRLREEDLVYGPQRAAVTIRNTKSNRPRAVPLTSRAEASLKALFLGGLPKETPLRRGWVTACKLARVKDVTFHTLRHTCATRLIAGNIPLPVVQKWLGHQDISTTMRYTHISDPQVMDAAKALEC